MAIRDRLQRIRGALRGDSPVAGPPVAGPPVAGPPVAGPPVAEPTVAPEPLSDAGPEAPVGARNYVILVLDSCRFDAWVKARPRHMSRLGEVQKRYSYATWTAPSHYNLLTGLLPHTSPQHVYASEYYKEDFLHFRERLGLPDMNFGSMIPSLWLPTYLRGLGFRTHMFASMPVLNPATPINRDFDTFELMDSHNDVTRIIRAMRFSADRPSFFVLNTGETHYPYATPDEPENEWPRISGVNGVFKQLDDQLRRGGLARPERSFDDAQLKKLQQRQIEAVRWVDRAVEELFDLCPPNTWLTITADHGELFGENGYFGHGPIHHEKVIEVPFVEGLVR